MRLDGVSCSLVDRADGYLLADGVSLAFRDVSALLPSEQHNEERAGSLRVRIAQEGVWRKPLLVHESTGVVMDGHHRLAVARSLALSRLPCVLLSYECPHLSIVTWAGAEAFDPERVLAAGRSGKLLGYKTTKHELYLSVPGTVIDLSALR